jgi:8-hydroxy-5-deazaflavin:NADPH oxidoreductase
MRYKRRHVGVVEAACDITLDHTEGGLERQLRAPDSHGMGAEAPLAFVGGTGKLGRGLGLRLAAAGHHVLLGSRSEDRAREAAAALHERLPGERALEGWSNADAVQRAEIVFLTLPFHSLRAFLAESGALLTGKIVVDVVNPLRLEGGRFELVSVPEGSVGAYVGCQVPGARVVSAFKNAAAGHLLRLDRPVDGDVLLAADDAAAKDHVAALAGAIPVLRPVDAGPLANATFLEAVAALELNLNRIHRALTSIRVLGLPDANQSSAS